MSKKIIITVPEGYIIDNIVTRINMAFDNEPQITVTPVDYLVEVVPEIVEAILRTKEEPTNA